MCCNRCLAVKSFIQKHKILVVVVAVIGAFWAYPLATAVQGNIEARTAVAQGHYVVHGFGMAVPWRKDYARLLQERYGIRYHRVAGCVVTESQVSYVKAYNAISTAAAIRQFGYDVFAECTADARTAWDEKAEAAIAAPKTK